MILDDIKPFVAEPIAQELDKLYAAFCQQSGLADLDVFIEYLRQKKLMDSESIGKLYDQDKIELSSLDIFGTNYQKGARLSDPELQQLLKQVLQPSRAHYQLIGQVGEGAMGFVHLARDQDLQRKVALKTIQGNLAQDQNVKKQFLSEVQITAQLEHPNIVPIYSLEVQPDGSLGYSMKLVQGKTLKQLIKEASQAVLADRPLDLEHDLPTLLEHFLKVCDAISYAHHKGVIHRDLKPANIMVGMFNEIYVMDWGIAKIMTPSLEEAESADFRQLIESLNLPASSKRTLAGEIVGTPRYMSPQQAAGKSNELDDKSDQFALGLILFEIVCLKPAFKAANRMELLVKVLKASKEPFEHLSPKVGIPRELRAIVNKATAKKTHDRYASIQAMAADIRRYTQGKSVSAEPDSPLNALLRWMSHHRQATFVTLLGMLLLCCLATIGSLYSRQHAIFETRRREESLSQFLLQVSQQKQSLENQLLGYETLIQGLAATVQATLAHGLPAREPVYFSEDYPSQPPPDLLPSSHYKQGLSLDWPVFKLAPGEPRAGVLPTAQKLSQVRHYLKSMFYAKMQDAHPELAPGQYAGWIRAKGAPLVWSYVAVAAGLHMAYPGHGGYAADYDPRQRPWYKMAVSRPGPQWGKPYQDASGQGMLLACTTAMVNEKGQLIGVVGLDLPLTLLLQNLLASSQQAHVNRVSLVNQAGEVILELPGTVSDSGAANVKKYPHPEILAALQAKTSGYLQLKSQLIAYQRLNVLGWYYIVETDQES